MLDKFMTFASELPASQLESVEAALAALMESHSESYAFTPSEMDELDRRCAEPKPEFAGKDEIERIFGKPFTA